MRWVANSTRDACPAAMSMTTRSDGADSAEGSLRIWTKRQIAARKGTYTADLNVRESVDVSFRLNRFVFFFRDEREPYKTGVFALS